MRNIKVEQASYIKDYRIKLTFSDSSIREIDLEKELWGEVFEPLKDVDEFKNFRLNPFTIEWSNGADFSPEFLYEKSTLYRD